MSLNAIRENEILARISESTVTLQNFVSEIEHTLREYNGEKYSPALNNLITSDLLGMSVGRV